MAEVDRQRARDHEDRRRGDNLGDEASDEGLWVPPMENFEAEGVQQQLGPNEDDVNVEVGDGNHDDDEQPLLANAVLNDRMAEMAARRRQAQDLYNRRSKQRFLGYVICSLGGALLHTYWAFCTRHQFYLAVVYLTSSKFAYVTMGNACICMTVLLFQIIVYFTLGGLRNVEQEAIGEGLRWGLMETCLAITIFRQEVDRHMVLLFLTLVLAKSLHWAAEYRGLHVQQNEMVHAHDGLQEYVLHLDDDGASQRNTNSNPLITTKWILSLLRGFKKQFGFLFLTHMLLFLDLWAVVYCATVCATLGPSAHILFGFEAAILFVSAINTLATHWVHWWDTAFYNSRHKTWHGRGTITFALEVALEGCKFAFYLIFFAIVFTYYGMPINIFRDLYMSYVNLKRKVTSFVKYRQLTTNMNARFENATQTELDECGRTCIICRDDITTGAGNSGKKLPCSHIFHFYCLREWLQQQQSCPTCRSEIPASWSKAKEKTAVARTTASATAVDADATANQEKTQEAEFSAEKVDSMEDKLADKPEEVERQANESEQTKGNKFSSPTKRRVDLLSPLLTPITAGRAASALGEHQIQEKIASKASPSALLLAHDDGESLEDQEPFPCLYRVTSVVGATVYENDGEKWLVMRCVGWQKVILCTRMEWMQGGTVVCPSDMNRPTITTAPRLSSQMMLRMPDGWVLEKMLERIPIPLSGFLDVAMHSSPIKMENVSA